jgi:sialidase-1
MQPEILTLAKCQGEVVRNSEAALLELKDKRILAIWPEFTKGPGDSDFFPSRLAAMTSSDGGRTWGNHRILIKPPEGELNVNSPSLVRLPDGSILLCFLRTHPLSKTRTGKTYPPTTGEVRISHDEGETFQPLSFLWQEEEKILANGTMKRLSTGRLINTANRDAPRPGEKRDHFQAGAYYSDDNGKTWHESANWVDGPKRGLMEPRVEELRKGHLLMIMRTQMGSIYKSKSADGGKTWSEGVTLGIEAPESCPDLLRVPATGDLVLIWNASKYDPQWASHFGKRTPLSVSVSNDDGQTWSAPRHLETDPKSAFSNTGCCFTSQGTLLVSYWTCAYTAKNYMANFPIDLKLAIVPMKWLYQKP